MTDVQHDALQAPESSVATEAANARPVIGLRHEAGLAAGHVMELCPGSYAFGPSSHGESGLRSGQPETQSFQLDVGESGDVVIVPGSASLTVSGAEVTAAQKFGPSELLEAGADVFTLVDLDTGREPVDSMPSGDPKPAKVLPVEVLGPVPSRLTWILLGLLGAALAVVVSWWFALLILVAIAGFAWSIVSARRELAADQKRHARQISEAQEDLRRQIQQRARSLNAKLRQQHRGPAAVLDPAPTDLQRNDRSVLPLGLADQPWKPDVEDRATAGWDYQPVADEVQVLPNAPLLVDLNNGPIAITGPRAGALAAARYLTAAMARRFTEGEMTLAAPDGDLWAWTRSMPRPSGASSQQLIDLGIPRRTFAVHDLPAGAPNHSVAGHGVVLAPEAALLPTGWQVHLEIRPDGTAAVRSNRGAVLTDSMIPHGVTAAAIAETVQPAALGANAVDTAHDGFVLHVSDDLALANDLLGSGAAKIAANLTPEECAIFVVDDGKRHMIRMQQMPHVRRYMGIDDRAIGSLLDEAEQALRSDAIVIILVAEIDQAYRHLIATGQGPRAKQLLYLASRSSDKRLIVAASALAGAELPPEVEAIVDTRIHRINGQATVIDRWGQRTIQLDEPNTADLTQSVARIRGH